MAKAKKAKRRGRPPSGEFSGLSAKPLQLRMPPDLRDELDKSAKARGVKVSQEMLYRLRRDLARSRADRRDPITFHLNALFTEIVNMVAVSSVSSSDPTAWRRNPFAFKSVRLAFDQVMKRLQPPGKLDRDEVDLFGPSSGHTSGYVVGGDTPEECANLVAAIVLMNMRSQVPPDDPQMKRASINFEHEVSRAWKVLTLNEGEDRQ